MLGRLASIHESETELADGSTAYHPRVRPRLTSKLDEIAYASSAARQHPDGARSAVQPPS